ncbi:lipopolysaccharide biosynthesis protein [Thioalkalivibrio sp. XN279]|uniref:lipopolysaccharide biosynthesis protein n=1 Tax=Thioalkalivibrio sp. XN279 TaxID=2714953 RepID=UPI00140BAF8C|nr:oligosaccharide flippase family protein [Thioalkalivibrio sp. XN279]NHA16050.1 oligosaccharide flippase family protein [Thioalkalivibrio sp. XN279]
MLKRNLIANYVGQGWAALMGVAFIPLYIKFLGIEAFGLIGLFAILVAWLSLLDLGLTPTLNREMARFTGGAHTGESIRDVLRSVEIIAIGVAIAISAATFLAAERIASAWLRVESLPVPVVAQAIAIMGLVTALRLVENVYRSSIMGLQRQVLFNVVNSAMATVRGFGAVGVLAWVSPTIQAFFIWQGVISIATLAALAWATYTTLPRGGRDGRFSLDALRGIRHFAGGMLGVTFLALLLTQIDKILLSRLLSLSEYGYYTVAALVAAGLYMLVGPIAQAWYPRLCELHARDDQVGLVKAYHQAAQLVSVTAGSAAIILILFAEPILRLWTQDPKLAVRVAPLLSLLALGNLLNGLMWIPYQTQLAHGWTSLAVRINLVAVLLVVPAILWATARYGPEGAAWAWVTLNAGYVLVGVHFMYRQILVREKRRWYVNDIVMPIAGALAAAMLIKGLLPSPESALMVVVTLSFSGGAAFAAAAFSAAYVREQIVQRSKLQPRSP